MQREQTFGLFDLAAACLRHWLIVVLVVGACTLAAIAYALWLRPVYRSEVVLIPAAATDEAGSLASLAGRFGGLASMVGLELPAGSTKEESIATLRSRDFTEQFIVERSLLPVLYEKRWDATQGAWKPGVRQPTIGDAVKAFDERIRSVNEDRRTGLVTLAIEWHDPKLAAEWANDMVSQLNERMRNRALAESKRSIEYLDQELGRTDVVELRQALFRLKESQVKQIMLASIRTDFAFRVIDPAKPSDPDKRVRPRRSFIALAGMGLGLALAVLLVAWLDWRGRFRAA
jgi:uncharacterized protein involved in exopolysaccharide biosynthesis